MTRWSRPESSAARWGWVGVALLSGVLLRMQHQLWWGQGGIIAWRHRLVELEHMQHDHATLMEHNRVLAANVDDLKHRAEAVEARAREDLGWIKQDETFYQVVTDAEHIAQQR